MGFHFIIIIIIIIIIITCGWVYTRWQGSFFTYCIIYARTMKVDYLRVHVVSETIPAFTLVRRETKKNLCRDGLSQDLPDTDF